MMGIADQPDQHLCVEVVEQVSNQGCLTAANLATDNSEPRLVGDAVLQHGIRHAVPLAHKQEFRIRMDGERFFPQPVKGFIHR